MVHIYLSGKKEPNQNEIQIIWINTKSCEKMPWDREWPTTTNDVNIKIVPRMLKILNKNNGKKKDKLKKLNPTIKNKVDFPCMVSKDNSINSNSNILFNSPPRFPAIDIKAKILIRKPKNALFFIILLQKKLISSFKYFWKCNLNNIEPIEYKAII